MYSAVLFRPYRAWPARASYPGLRSFLASPWAITFRAFGPEQVALNLVPSLPDPILTFLGLFQSLAQFVLGLVLEVDPDFSGVTGFLSGLMEPASVNA